KENAIAHIALGKLQLARKETSMAEEELHRALATATGEDKRESLELADLLVLLRRKGDALKLLSNLAGEPASARDASLQLRTARLARELGAEDIVAEACARLRGAAGRCP